MACAHDRRECRHAATLCVHAPRGYIPCACDKRGEVTAPKLFSPTSVAGYAGPSSSFQTTPECPVLLSEVQSGVLHAWPHQWGSCNKPLSIDAPPLSIKQQACNKHAEAEERPWNGRSTVRMPSPTLRHGCVSPLSVIEVLAAVEAHLNAPHNLDLGRFERAPPPRVTGARDTQVHWREPAER